MWFPTGLLSSPGRFLAVQADFLAVQVDLLAAQGHFLAVQIEFLAERLIFEQFWTDFGTLGTMKNSKKCCTVGEFAGFRDFARGAHKKAQHALKRAPREAKLRSRSAPGGPRSAPEGPRSGPRTTKSAPRAPKSRSNSASEQPWLPNDAHLATQIAQRAPGAARRPPKTAQPASGQAFKTGQPPPTRPTGLKKLLASSAQRQGQPNCLDLVRRRTTGQGVLIHVRTD